MPIKTSLAFSTYIMVNGKPMCAALWHDDDAGRQGLVISHQATKALVEGKVAPPTNQLALVPCDRLVTRGLHPTIDGSIQARFIGHKFITQRLPGQLKAIANKPHYLPMVGY